MASTLAMQDQVFWQKCVQTFRTLVGSAELSLRYQQGEIAEQVWAKWGAEGLSRLSQETGLSVKFVQEVWRFRQTFCAKTWDTKLPYRIHGAIAWFFQISHMQGEFIDGKTPAEWLELVSENAWDETAISERMAWYYGLFPMNDQDLREKLLRKNKARRIDIHPTVVRQLTEWGQHNGSRPRKKLRRSTGFMPKSLPENSKIVTVDGDDSQVEEIDQIDQVIISDESSENEPVVQNQYIVFGQWKVVAGDADAALETIRTKLKMGDVSGGEFSVE